MPTDERVLLNEDSANDLDVFSENIFATSFFKFPQILQNLGYLLIHQPGVLKAWNPERKQMEIARPDFEIIHPHSNKQIILEVTESSWLRDFSHNHKGRQLRVMDACQNGERHIIPLLFTWEVLIHPQWALTLIRSVAQGYLGRNNAVDLMDQSIRHTDYDIQKIPH